MFSRLRRRLDALSAFGRLAWLLLGLILLTAALLCWGGWFDLGRLAGADYWMQQARESVQAKNWSAAALALQKVPDTHRHDPPFLRVLADYLIATHTQPQMLADALELLKNDALMRPEDHLWQTRAWLAARSVAKARAAWKEIPAPLSQGIEAARLNVDLLRREGRLREAEQAQAALADYAGDLSSQAVRQAVLDLNQSAFPEKRHQAEAKLWELARRQDAARLDAIRMLSRQEGRTEKEAGELLTLMEQHPKSGTPDRLTVISLLIRLAPARKADLIQTEMSRADKKNPAEWQSLAIWLAQEGEMERLQKLRSHVKLPPQEWFTLEARALAAVKRWQPLLDLVAHQEHEPVSRAELAHWQAVAWMQLHPQDSTKPHDLLQQSIRLGHAEKNLPLVTMVARIAEDWHMNDLALEASLILAQPGTPQEVVVVANCLRIATTLKDTAMLAELAARLARLQPDNLIATRRATYLGLLLGENLELVPGKTTTLAADDASGWLLAAFKTWRFGDHPSARDALKHIQSTTELTPGERAVLAGLLAKTGETAHGFQIAEKIPAELLLPEENQFLNMAR